MVFGGFWLQNIGKSDVPDFRKIVKIQDLRAGILELIDDFPWNHENPVFEKFWGSKFFSEKKFCSTNFYYKIFFQKNPASPNV